MPTESDRRTTVAWQRLVGWIDSDERPHEIKMAEVRHAVRMAIRAGIEAEKEALNG